MQKMKPWLIVAVAAVVSLLAPRAAPVRAQSEGCKNLVIQVHDPSGVVIPNALVTFDQSWSVPTDFEGRARLDCRSLPRNSVMVEVAAHGYKPVRLTLSSDPLFARNNVYLERQTTADAPASATVNARELSPDVQKRSSALQEEAMAALKRGDNDGAEKLLMQALELTPSSSSIHNSPNTRDAQAPKKLLKVPRRWIFLPVKKTTSVTGWERAAP